MAALAGVGRGPGGGARAATAPTGRLDRERDRARGTAGCLLELDLHLRQNVGSTGSAPARRRGHATEEVVPEEDGEDVGEAREVEVGRSEAARAKALVAEAVIQLACLLLRQDLVRLSRLAEALLRVGMVGNVRMEISREPAEGRPDLLLARTLREAENLVVITLCGGHVLSLLRGSAPFREGLAKHQLSRRAALDRREAASSVAPVFQTNTNATCVLASRRPSRPCDERHSAKPSPVSSNPVAGVDKRAMAALSSGHLATDLAQGALPALLPFLIVKFDLSYTMAAALVLAATISSSLVQPAFGVWSDIRGALWLLPAGVALAGVGMALASVAPSYPLVLVAVLAAGVGVAAYHPEGSKFASYVSGERRASGMAFFSVGGNVGFALGPAFASGLVLWLGLTGGLLLALPGLAGAPRLP